MRTLKRHVLVAAFALVACVSPSTKRIHAENMAKAASFKATFDRELNGASFDETLKYLRAHDLHFGPFGLTNPQDTPPSDGNGRLELEMFREKSPNWYCGKGSVGLSVWFTQNKVTQTEAVFWSFDCP